MASTVAAAMPEPTPSAFESIWFVEATYAPDGAERRIPFRAEHLARWQALRAAGTLIEVGAFPDASASILLIRAGTEDEVRGLLEEDVYTRNGVWMDFRVRPFNRLRPAAGSPIHPTSRAGSPGRR